jgi:signal transduction histidine kinase
MLSIIKLLMNKTRNENNQLLNNLKFLLFRTKLIDNKFEIIFDEKTSEERVCHLNENKIITKNKFVIFYESITFTNVLFNIIYYFVSDTNLTMKYLSGLYAIVYFSIKVFLILNFFLKKEKIKFNYINRKAVNIFNFLCNYAIIISNIFILSFQTKSLPISTLQFLLYFLIINGCLLIFLIDDAILNIFSLIVEFFTIIFFLIYCNNPSLIIPLILIKIITSSFTFSLKIKTEELSEENFFQLMTILKLNSKMIEILKEVNADLFILKNGNIIFKSWHLSQDVQQDSVYAEKKDLMLTTNINLLSVTSNKFKEPQKSSDWTSLKNPEIKEILKSYKIDQSDFLEIQEKHKLCQEKIHIKKDNLFNIPNLYSFLKNLTESYTNKSSCDCFDSFRMNNSYIKLGLFSRENGTFSQTFEIFLKIYLEAETEYSVTVYFFPITERLQLQHQIQKQQNSTQNIKNNFRNQVHEFKTPLNSLVGCCNELAEDINKEFSYETFSSLKVSTNKKTFQNFISKINSNIKQLRSISYYIQFLIRDIITKDQEMNIEKRQLKVSDILDFCMNILNCLLLCDERKNQNIQARLVSNTSKNLLIDADDIRVKQIMLNFISNAVKFTNSGSICIEAEEDYNTLKLSVEDTGIGVKEELKSLLFVPYSKLTEENNEFGTGLGLCICKQIANKMEMDIFMKSQENIGTKMTLVVPLKRAQNIKNKRSNTLEFKDQKETLFNSPRNNLSRNDENSPMSNISKLESSNVTRTLSYKAGFPMHNFNEICLTSKKHNESEFLDKTLKELDKIRRSGTVDICKRSNSLIEKDYVFVITPPSKNKILVIDDQKFVRSAIVLNLKDLLRQNKINDYEILEGTDGVDLLKMCYDHSDFVKCILTDENMNFLSGTEAVKLVRKLKYRNRPKIFLTSAVEHYQDIFDGMYPKPVSKEELLEVLHKAGILDL